jgi:hypothetical protein
MMMTTDTGTPERGNAQVAPLRYSQLKNLAAELSRPVSTLIALAPANDPFSITPSRRDGAHWFARIWKRLAIGLGVISAACITPPCRKTSRSKCRMARHTRIRLKHGKP